MTRKHYGKLVRDHIPDIIAAEGRACQIETLSEEQYRQALLVKLVEEAQEAAQADREALVSELADLYEVIAALMKVEGITAERVSAVQEQRRTERGGFEKRIRLLWTE